MQEQPFSEWSSLDFALFVAYKTLQDERCSQCGLPRYVCHSENPDIQFSIDEDQCVAKREIERYEEAERDRHDGDSDWKPPKGTTLVPRVETVSGADPTSYRDEYYNSMRVRLEEFSRGNHEHDQAQ